MSKLNRQNQNPSSKSQPQPSAQTQSSAVLDLDDVDAIEGAIDAEDAKDAKDVEDVDGRVDESIAADTNSPIQAPPATIPSPSVPIDNPPAPDSRLDNAHSTLVNEYAELVARQAVERVLVDQAESRLFDVFDGRVTITLPADDLTILESQWREQNSRDLGSRIPFSTFIANRLRRCRSHTADRAIYVNDTIRQSMEELFGDVVYDAQDLMNKIDRHLRPIIESPDNPTNIMRLKPLDPFVMEIVPGWYPDKTPVEAISDFVNDAIREKAGLA